MYVKYKGLCMYVQGSEYWIKECAIYQVGRQDWQGTLRTTRYFNREGRSTTSE